MKRSRRDITKGNSLSPSIFLRRLFLLPIVRILLKGFYQVLHDIWYQELTCCNHSSFLIGITIETWSRMTELSDECLLRRRSIAEAMEDGYVPRRKKQRAKLLQGPVTKEHTRFKTYKVSNKCYWQIPRAKDLHNARSRGTYWTATMGRPGVRTVEERRIFIQEKKREKSGKQESYDEQYLSSRPWAPNKMTIF